MKKSLLISALLISFLLLHSSLAIAAPITIDLETAAYAELSEAKSLIEARMEEAYQEELSSYQPIESANGLSVSPDTKVSITGTAIKVAEGLADVQAIVSLPDESQFVVSYIPNETLPKMIEGNGYTIHGVFAGYMSIGGNDIPSMSIIMLEAAKVPGAPSSQLAYDDPNADFPAKGYTWSTSMYHYLGLVVRNNTPLTVEIEANVVFKDASGKIVGAKNSSEYAFESGCDIALIFSSDISFDSYEYDISASPETYYSPVLSSLEYEVTINESKAILSVTNTGSKAAQFVEAYVLFMNDDEVVYYSSHYITDNDNEIKPGKTLLQEFNAYRTQFDSIQVFFTGRATK